MPTTSTDVSRRRGPTNSKSRSESLFPHWRSSSTTTRGVAASASGGRQREWRRTTGGGDLFEQVGVLLHQLGQGGVLAAGRGRDGCLGCSSELARRGST